CHGDDRRPHRRRRAARHGRGGRDGADRLSRHGLRLMRPLLVIDDVHAGYQSGVDILQGLSLSVAPGGLTLVIGPNGAGKSTLLKTAFGFLRPSRGRIRFADTEIAGAAPFAIKRLGISYVPQEINVFPLLTIEENLRMGGWVFRRDRARLRAQIERVYAIFPALAE